MATRRISITFVAILFATISFGQVKSIDEQYTETNIPVVTSSEQNEEYDSRIGLPTLMAHRKFIINFKNMWMRFED